MALPILDGNQTSTTLATTVSGGAHYPNHIIANGTVTANVAEVVGEDGTSILGKAIGVGFNSTPDGEFRNVSQNNPFPVDINSNSIPQISGTVTANVDGGFLNSVGAVAEIRNGDGDVFGLDIPFPVIGTVTLGTGSAQIGSVTASVINSVTVGSLPVQLSTTTIGGTARLNVTLSSATTVGATAPSYANLYGGSDGTNLRAISVDSSGRTVVTGTTTITVGALEVLPARNSANVLTNLSTEVGTNYLLVRSYAGSGSLTTRFGSVTTANTAQLTAAVTNSARRYLLCQNLDPSVTVTIGIGFTPTTTQGIQLAAGGGIIMDSFVGTGAVWWLSSSTGSNFSILEG